MFRNMGSSVFGFISGPKSLNIEYRAVCPTGDSDEMIRFALLTLFLVGGMSAQGNLGIFEGASDVGNPSQKGSVASDAGKREYRVTGGGANIWAKSDDFYFVWHKISGDFTLTAVGDASGPLQKTGSADVGIGDSAYVGLAACPHDDKSSVTVVFSDVTLQTPDKPSAQRPQALQMPGRPPVRSFVTIYNVADGSKKVVYTAEGFYQAPNWSPDGKYLLMNTPGKLWRFSLDEAKMEPVSTLPAKSVNNDHGISKDGRWFAVSGGNIYVLPSGGGEARQVTKETPSYFHGFSPDGRWLAYCAKRGDNYDIYRIPFEGGDEQRLTTSPGYDDGSEYSPDGKWIYFNSNRAGTWDIWRMPADGAGPDDAKAERITSDELEDWFPHISPDGKMIVFVSFEKGIPDHPANKNVVLRMMPAPGAKAAVPQIREVVRLFGGQGTINVNSWAPDSKRFAYVSYEFLK